MELSFRSKVLLQLAVAVLSVLTLFYPYLGILAAAIVVVLLVNEMSVHESDKADFKKKIADEALGIVDRVIVSTNAFTILRPVWSSKTEGFKTDVLGSEDYNLWKQFYDSIEERNRYYQPRMSLDWTVFSGFNRRIFDKFLKVCRDISWVREYIPEESVSSLISRAEESASV